MKDEQELAWLISELKFSSVVGHQKCVAGPGRWRLVWAWVCSDLWQGKDGPGLKVG